MALTNPLTAQTTIETPKCTVSLLLTHSLSHNPSLLKSTQNSSLIYILAAFGTGTEMLFSQQIPKIFHIALKWAPLFAPHLRLNLCKFHFCFFYSLILPSLLLTLVAHDSVFGKVLNHLHIHLSHMSALLLVIHTVFSLYFSSILSFLNRPHPYIRLRPNTVLLV